MIVFGQIDFWDVHGIGFVVAMFFFPRLTMLLGTVHGGLLWWLGWIFAPRLQVAIIATIRYWETNPVLVAFTWGWALAGEGCEGCEKCAAERKRQEHLS